MKKKISAGRRFYNWTVLETPAVDTQNAKVVCICVCGTRRSVRAKALLFGESRSCGCLRVSMLVERRQRKLTVEGKTKTLMEWAEETGVPASTIRNRLWLGKSAIEAVVPVRSKFRNHKSH